MKRLAVGIGLIVLALGLAVLARGGSHASEGLVSRATAASPSTTLTPLESIDAGTARPPAPREAQREVATEHTSELAANLRPSIEILVLSESEPRLSFSAAIEDSAGHRVSAWNSNGFRARREDLPETFYVSATSPWYVPQRLGPFQAESAPARIDVMLERVNMVTGVVLSAGAPVAGAELHAHVPVQEGSLGWMSEHFTTFVELPELSRIHTDDEGRFAMTLPVAGRYRLHASAPGLARGASDWITVERRTHLEDLVLELPPAGALEGRVLVANGVEPRDLWIGASNGEGHVELTQTNLDGSFRFGALAPGRWQVHRIRPGQERNARSERSIWLASRPAPPSWDVEVHAGTTANLDIDARNEVTCTLEGRLTLGGAPARGLKVRLEATTRRLDAEGRFTLRASQAGRCVLSFGGPTAGWTVPIDLVAGANTWTLDLPVGVVELANLPELREDRRQRGYALFWSRGEMSWSANFAADDTRSTRIESVPAGALVLRWRDEGADLRYPERWPVLANLTLAPGQILALRLP